MIKKKREEGKNGKNAQKKKGEIICVMKSKHNE